MDEIWTRHHDVNMLQYGWDTSLYVWDGELMGVSFGDTSDVEERFEQLRAKLAERGLPDISYERVVRTEGLYDDHIWYAVTVDPFYLSTLLRGSLFTGLLRSLWWEWTDTQMNDWVTKHKTRYTKSQWLRNSEGSAWRTLFDDTTWEVFGKQLLAKPNNIISAPAAMYKIIQDEVAEGQNGQVHNNAGIYNALAKIDHYGILFDAIPKLAVWKWCPEKYEDIQVDPERKLKWERPKQSDEHGEMIDCPVIMNYTAIKRAAEAAINLM
jgi:hypothetical protein